MCHRARLPVAAGRVPVPSSGLTTLPRVKPTLVSGGDCPILQQDTAPCSWETCLTDASRHPDVPQTKCSLDCFRLQLRQQLCERGSHHPAGTAARHHLLGCTWRPPHLVEGARGFLSPFHMGERNNKTRNTGESATKSPQFCPHPRHPLPVPPHALTTFLCCSSCFPPTPRRGCFQPTFPKKCTWRGSNSRKRLQGQPGDEGPLALLLRCRPLAVLALSRRLAAVRSQVLLGFYEKRSLGDGGGALCVLASTTGQTGEPGGEDFHRGDAGKHLHGLDGAELQPVRRERVDVAGRIPFTESPVSASLLRFTSGLP
ncbi:uncharacterized protein LOC141735176 isoform X1 [Larus michahellis]|uniref:uncharacterized protein LOC141735176 isoform X1 n=1 Tax=Larus michahellis TaxID=119627 RepID=UPI003D9B674E